jgi:hypothetical protein
MKPKTPDGIRVSKTKVILQFAFWYILTRLVRVYLRNERSDLAVKMYA